MRGSVAAGSGAAILSAVREDRGSKPVGKAPGAAAPEARDDRGASSLSALAPVERRTVQSRVYEQLRHSLIEGQFDAGEILRIQDLAARLETSTMPVREALGRLVAEQALEALPSRSVRVPLLTRERLDDVARARILVEAEAVRLAVPRLTRQDVDGLAAISKAYDGTMAANGDHAGRAAYNHAFHFRIYRAAGSKVLLPIIESLWLQTGPFIRASSNIYDGADGLSATHHHWHLVDALAARNAQAAVEALGLDIGRAFDLLRVQLMKGDADGAQTFT